MKTRKTGALWLTGIAAYLILAADKTEPKVPLQWAIALVIGSIWLARRTSDKGLKNLLGWIALLAGIAGFLWRGQLEVLLNIDFYLVKVSVIGVLVGLSLLLAGNPPRQVSEREYSESSSQLEGGFEMKGSYSHSHEHSHGHDHDGGTGYSDQSS